MTETESRLAVLMADENGPAESGYGSNGTSEITLSSVNEDASSSRSCSVSAEETPDHPGPPTVVVGTGNEEAVQIRATAVNGAAVRRSKAAADEIAALRAHRLSCPTGMKDLAALATSDQLNSSFGSVHSSGSNVSVERLTATDDEVRVIHLVLIENILNSNEIVILFRSGNDHYRGSRCAAQARQTPAGVDGRRGECPSQTLQLVRSDLFHRPHSVCCRELDRRNPGRSYRFV